MTLLQGSIEGRHDDGYYFTPPANRSVAYQRMRPLENIANQAWLSYVMEVTR